MNPPWILFNFVILWLGLLSEALDLDPQLQESNSTAKERVERQILERERRLIPYMTFYVAHSLRNPNSGERQNVLIPIQTQQPKVERVNPAPQIQPNNIQNVPQPQRYEVPVTQPVTVRFPENDFYPTPSIELTPKEEYKGHPEGLRVLSQIYRFKSPGPQPQQRPQQQQSQQQPLAPQPLLRPAYQQVPIRPRVNQKYSEPQIIKLIPYNPSYSPSYSQSYSPVYNPGFSPQYFVATPRPQLTYTSTKLQNLANNPYIQNDQNYYKGATRTVVDTAYIPGKVYAVNIIPQTAPKVAIQRLRPRPTPEKANINQVFIGTTTPTPYRTQVKFELEDARVPSAVNALQLEKVREPTPITYPTESISTNYINTQGQITEPPKKEEPNVYYTHQISQERPSHVTFVPVRAQPQPLTPETIRIEQVTPIQSTPVSQVDQIELVQENTPRPQAHETNDIAPPPQDVAYDDYDATKVVQPEPKPSLDTSVVNLLTILKQTNQLPQNFTPENIDNSIKTLALILERLQNERNFQTFSTASKPKTKPKPTAVTIITEEKENKVHSYPSPSGTSTPGRPGIDYPTYATIPQTQFDCATQRYKGFFGDPDTNCQVWHYCDLNGGQASFLCPNGTIFSQVALTCDWWFNVKCASTSQLYVLNERLYKYILPFSPSFPEDYSGPLVDRYLAAKFKEMEAKSRLKALKALISTAKPETSPSSTPAAETTPVYSTEAE